MHGSFPKGDLDRDLGPQRGFFARLVAGLGAENQAAVWANIVFPLPCLSLSRRLGGAIPLVPDKPWPKRDRRQGTGVRRHGDKLCFLVVIVRAVSAVNIEGRMLKPGRAWLLLGGLTWASHSAKR